METSINNVRIHDAMYVMRISWKHQFSINQQYNNDIAYDDIAYDENITRRSIY